MKLGAPVLDTDYTPIQAINALANFFKHHEEWPHDWKNADGQAKATIAVIQELGAEESSRCNLQICFHAIGIPNKRQIRDLAGDISQWTEALCDHLRTKLDE